MCSPLIVFYTGFHARTQHFKDQAPPYPENGLSAGRGRRRSATEHLLIPALKALAIIRYGWRRYRRTAEAGMARRVGTAAGGDVPPCRRSAIAKSLLGNLGGNPWRRRIIGRWTSTTRQCNGKQQCRGNKRSFQWSSSLPDDFLRRSLFPALNIKNTH
jgi:hypothetical protein